MSVIKIVPPERTEQQKKLPAGGWQYQIETADGAVIHGVRSMRVNFELDDLVTADVEVFSSFDQPLNAEAKFHIRNPFTGELSQVRKIEFMDGSSVDLADLVSIPQATWEEVQG